MAQPEKKYKQGCVSVAIFANGIQVNGATIPRMNVVPQKVYKDKEGNWKNSTNFGVNDVPKLIVALSKAYDYMTGKADGE